VIVNCVKDMNITLKEIIFISIFLVFGKVVRNLKLHYRKVFPLPIYRYKYLNNTDINKITKHLYTSVYNSNNLYIVIEIPINKYLNYSNKDILLSKSVYSFIIVFMLNYIDNDYLNILVYNNSSILFIIDSIYSIDLLEKLAIINIFIINNIKLLNTNNTNTTNNTNKSFLKLLYKKNSKSINITDKHTHPSIALNTKTNINKYELLWLKHITKLNKYLLLLYLCFFSKYKNDCHILLLELQNIHICNIIYSFFKEITILSSISDIKTINSKYHSIGFRHLSKQVISVDKITTYLDKNAIININYNNTELINKLISYSECKHNTHYNTNHDIINQTGFYYYIGFEPYCDKLQNDVFENN
jgi:hypothetical protein